MNADAAREVVRAIPVPALVPARMLVDEAVGIVGRHAVVRRARRPGSSFYFRGDAAVPRRPRALPSPR